MVISICGKVFRNTYVPYNKDLLYLGRSGQPKTGSAFLFRIRQDFSWKWVQLKHVCCINNLLWVFSCSTLGYLAAPNFFLIPPRENIWPDAFPFCNVVLGNALPLCNHCSNFNSLLWSKNTWLHTILFILQKFIKLFPLSR